MNTLPSVMVSGPYLHSSTSVDEPINYSMFLSEWLRMNPFFSDIFDICGDIFENYQPTVDIMAKLRDPAIPDTQQLFNNNAMLGFQVPPTSLISNEPYIVMKTLGNFYVSRDASYVFMNYLSFIKNTQLIPQPLWANSLTMPISQLVPYTPPEIVVTENPISYNSNQLTFKGIGIFYGVVKTVDSESNGLGNAVQNMTGYFPTTYFDVTYTANDFVVDESVILQFILQLKPAHLVFRQFDAVWVAEINYDIPNPIAQIFSYVGSVVENS